MGAAIIIRRIGRHSFWTVLFNGMRRKFTPFVERSTLADLAVIAKYLASGLLVNVMEKWWTRSPSGRSVKTNTDAQTANLPQWLPEEITMFAPHSRVLHD